jgi:hypothetical protein
MRAVPGCGPNTRPRSLSRNGKTLPGWKRVPGGDGTGPEVADVVQLLHLITAGRVIRVLSRSLVEPLPAGLAGIPVTDAPSSRLVLAWNSRDRRPLVASLVAAALRLRRADSGGGAGNSGEVVALLDVRDQAGVSRLPAQQPLGLRAGHDDVQRDEGEALEVVGDLVGRDAHGR